jgi:CRP/FNR family cyclic AMP-dependent transcriptional regulator
MIGLIEALDLKALELFSGLPEDELDALAALFRRATVPAGTVLISAQGLGEAVYIVVSGSVRIQISQESGNEIILALLGPGDIVGEMSLLTGRGRSANVITREETSVLWLERRAFLDSLLRIPRFCRNLVLALSRRLQAANERFHALAALDVTGRVARQLLELAERYGRQVPGDGTQIVFPVTQGELAEMIGATRERVNPIMVRLRKAGVISVDSESRIAVHRPDALADLCRL